MNLSELLSSEFASAVNVAETIFRKLSNPEYRKLPESSNLKNLVFRWDTKFNNKNYYSNKKHIVKF